jgi:acetyl-CoA carboxylase biotin carboxyl carrier protein
MNIKKIQELIELMNTNDLAEIDVELEGMKVRLTKRSSGLAVHEVIQAATVQSLAHAAAPGAAEKAAAEARKLLEVKAPMVGTFYGSPSPDSDPYVKIGNVVHKGDVLCIVEAMKLMNEVKSELEGRVVDILVENAEPVEFGQTMFLLEPL